jgi:hypothetical protein
MPQIVRDIFNNILPSPREDNLNAKKLFPSTARSLGLDPLKVNDRTKETWDPVPPECLDKDCRALGRCTSFVSGQIRCGNCGRMWWPNGVGPEVVYAGRNGLIARRLQ